MFSMMPKRNVINFVKAGALQRGSNPGFSHALQLTHNTLHPSELTVADDGKRVVYKYRTSTGTKPSTSLLLAILDEFTTNAQPAFRHPCAPGVTLHMQLERAYSNGRDLPDSFTAVSSARRMGKRMTFLDCSFYDENDQLVAFGNQVKYLPTGSWLLDFALSSPFLVGLYHRLFVQSKDVPEYPPVSNIHDILKPQTCSVNRATYKVTPSLTNAFGTLHGGAQAMMMESVGGSLARQVLGSDYIELRSMQVDCLSPGKGTVDAEAKAVAQQQLGKDLEPTTTIQVILTRKNKPLSVGYLQFSALDPGVSSKL